MDKEVFIRARKVDYDLVETVAKEAAAEFEKNSGYAVEAEIDTDGPLESERYLFISIILKIVLEE